MPKDQITRPVPADHYERLSAWARRKPRIALMGEFSSGKSTLLNLLTGTDLLPTRVTATELPPVWFSHGQPRAYWVDRDGSRHALDFGTFDGVPRSARHVRVFAPAPVLERCDIIDTPGISDPNLEEDSWRFAVGQASFILWCTPATQAWRETERSTWAALPDRLRANSVLVVTRADKLGPGDREKVTRRLTRESFGLFGGLVFLSSLDAVRGRALLAETGDAEAWRQSGGADLDARIDAGIAAVQAERLDLLDRYVPTSPSPRAAVPVASLPGAAPAGQREDAPLALFRIFGSSEPVRPRRVDLPETRRTERPAAEDAADTLGAMRAGWMSLRSAGSEPAEPAPVLRLTDPPVEEPPRPASPEPAAGDGESGLLVLGPAWAAEPVATAKTPAPAEDRPDEALALLEDAPALRTAEAGFDGPVAEEGPEPAAERTEPLWDEPPAAEAPEPAAESAPATEEAISLEAVMAAVAEPEPEALAAPEPEAPAAEALPRAVRIWREIVARTPEIPSNSPILAMIDQLLCELSLDNELPDVTGQASATIIAQNRAA